MIGGAFIYGCITNTNNYKAFLPNSCFVESVYFSSQASLILKISGITDSKLFLYRYQEVQPNLLMYNKKIFGHAIVVFEYSGILWIYDPNHGTMYIGSAVYSEFEKKLEVIKYIEETQKVKIIEYFFINDFRI